jgi:hypothetical protein
MVVGIHLYYCPSPASVHLHATRTPVTNHVHPQQLIATLSSCTVALAHTPQAAHRPHTTRHSHATHETTHTRQEDARRPRATDGALVHTTRTGAGRPHHHPTCMPHKYTLPEPPRPPAPATSAATQAALRTRAAPPERPAALSLQEITDTQQMQGTPCKRNSWNTQQMAQPARSRVPSRSGHVSHPSSSSRHNGRRRGRPVAPGRLGGDGMMRRRPPRDAHPPPPAPPPAPQLLLAAAPAAAPPSAADEPEGASVCTSALSVCPKKECEMAWNGVIRSAGSYESIFMIRSLSFR